jgi:Coenzyme PQQ synthesis protein D (PqqD)
MARLATHIRRVSNADGGTILDLRRGAMFSLNPIAVEILDRLERGEDVPAIAQELSARFGVAKPVVEADIEEFVACLRQQGVLDPCASEDQSSWEGPHA